MERMANVADKSMFNGAGSSENMSRVGLPCAEVQEKMVDLGKNQERAGGAAHAGTCSIKSCTNKATLNVVRGSAKKAFCKKHAETCRIAGCTTRATYRMRGNENPAELCRRHAANRLDMVHVHGRSCAEPGCIAHATHGPPSPPMRREFCIGHRKPGMVYLTTMICFRPGCGRERRYGVAGSDFAEFCSTHAVEGMVPSRNLSCDIPGCTRARRYGAPGKSREQAEFCDLHAEQGMVNLSRGKPRFTKSCSHPSCTQKAEYGPRREGRGGGSKDLCLEHAADGMVGPGGWVKEAEKIEPPSSSSSPEAAAPPADGLCGHPSGCTKKATHGVRGNRKRELCLEHAKNTPLVYLSGYWCRSPGCDQWPSFGLAGRAREYCRSHAKGRAGMVNVSSRTVVQKCTLEQRGAEAGTMRKLTCEEPCAPSTTLRRGGGVSTLSKDSREANRTRPREPSQPPQPLFLAATVEGRVAGAEQDTQAAPIDAAAAAASQADVVEPFMGLMKRRRRAGRVRALVREAGSQVELGSCEENDQFWKHLPRH